MNREQAKELLPVIQAYADGAKLQCRVKPSGKHVGIWTDLEPGEEPLWMATAEYRIKPREPRTFEVAVKGYRSLEHVRSHTRIIDIPYFQKNGYEIIEVQEVIKD